MEQQEYRTRERLARWRRNGTVAAVVAGVDLLGTPKLATLDDSPGDPGWIEHLNPVLQWPADWLSLDVPVNPLVMAAGAAVGVGSALRARQRQSEHFELRQRRHAKGWATLRDLAQHSGVLAARLNGRNTRPTFDTWSCWRRPVTEFGAILGEVITGSGLVRGRMMVNNWERGVLVVGEPGTYKSTLVAGTVLDFPGAAMIVSTKDEFWAGTGEVRESAVGPALLFDPFGTTDAPSEKRFRWNLVRGCADGHVAQGRAAALLSTLSGRGLSDASFWGDKARQLMTVLLMAADLGDQTLRDLAGWMQRETFDVPRKILARHSSQLEDYLMAVLESLQQAKAERTASSIAQTGSTILQFMADSRVADALNPSPDDETDIEQFLRNRGTLYLITGNNPAIGPVISVLAHAVTSTAKRITAADSHRLDPPLAWIIDEAHLTMPSVPLHEFAAELRSTGVWMLVAVQNRAQIEEHWGKEAAKTLQASLQTTVVTGAHEYEDRKHYSDRVDTRTETHVTSSTSNPDSTKHRWFGNPFGAGRSATHGTQRVEVPIMRPGEFSHLGAREALVIQNKGRCALIRFPNHWDRAAALRERLAAEQAVGATRFDRIKARRAARAGRTATAAAEEGVE